MSHINTQINTLNKTFSQSKTFIPRSQNSRSITLLKHNIYITYFENQYHIFSVNSLFHHNIFSSNSPQSILNFTIKFQKIFNLF
jgi:hypothetical protein